MSIHAGSDAPDRAGVASTHARSVIPYASPEVAWSAAAVALVALAIYLRTMLPSTGFWDTGEAQTVPHTLSIFHPTGFPTYTLVGWLWSQLPLGTVAWRMNLLSGVCMAGASALLVLSVEQLAAERHRWTVAGSAAVAGLAFALASEPWRNAIRADVHALHVLLAAVVIWLLLVWRAAERVRAPRAGGWLLAASLLFGLGMGNHPLIGLMAFGVGAWLLFVDRDLWRRWRLVLGCIGLLLLGMSVYAYIPIRALLPPEPPLFYARPTTFERLRYLLLAEQFRDLFNPLASPFANFGAKWTDAAGVLGRQFLPPGWLLAAVGAAILAARDLRAFLFLLLLVLPNVLYSMNFVDGDIARYYMLTVLVAAIALGVGISAVAAWTARAMADASRRSLACGGRRRAAIAGGALVLGAAALLPAGGLLLRYPERAEQGANRDADAWVASVHAALPQNAVVISWWSYSTPLWYHRWVLGERPDVAIIDERTILDNSAYGTIDRTIAAFLGKRPVYLVPPFWELDRIVLTWETETIPTYSGYTDLLHVEGPR
ncbi:MAG TPA: DUF2723 domain-containing protein [Candidatus Limnocylindria bacterium]|nr:DUF2723 domain-containing protein [Candidatus Limnocylindria bacterium]